MFYTTNVSIDLVIFAEMYPLKNNETRDSFFGLPLRCIQIMNELILWPYSNQPPMLFLLLLF